MWPYPVDNEYRKAYGLCSIVPLFLPNYTFAESEEAHIGFHEHVFLDHLIEEGFPKKGPIRQFMELVRCGADYMLPESLF